VDLRKLACGKREPKARKTGKIARSRNTKDVDLAALRAPDLAEAERALAALAEADLGIT
jgi:hypothetical protein